MKRNTPSLILGCTTVLFGAACLNSCKLPTDNNWRTVQTSGLIPALLESTPQQQVVQKNSGPAPLKVSPVMAPRVIDIPVGEPVQGRAGYVYSPFAPDRRIVDVREFKSGEEVRCPITLKSFLVPDFSKTMGAQSIAINQKPVGSEVASTDPTAGLGSDLSLTPPRGTKVSDGTGPHLTPDKPSNQPPVPTGAQAELPFGRRVPGRPGFVYSPYASQYQLVDVAGIAPGVEVRCPYTNKLFRVPQPLAEETSNKPADQPKEQPKPEVKQNEQPKEMVKEQPKPTVRDTPKEQPKPAPPARVNPEVKPEANPQPQPAAADASPTATWAQQDKGLVQSPFGQPGQLVDVTGKAGGAKVVCPFTGKTFVVPAQ